ncbi:MAG: hypothetical protein JO360_17475 [Acidobacteria bacterium]|nr:hypothetical protein [Acidobacteriota bacterium]
MKYSKACTLALLLLIPQITFTQTRRPQRSPFQKSAAAERAWPAFFRRLKSAVKRRDRARLKGMMIPEFHYTLGHHAGPQEDDFREDAFKHWDASYNPTWKDLERTLAKGAVPLAAWWREGNRELLPPTRVAPPAANTKWRIDGQHVRFIAMFEYRDGRWYFVLFDFCCD